MKLYPNVTILFCIWSISVLTVLYLGFSSLPHSNLFPNDFIKSLANWDGGHYTGIAQYGYREKFQYVFFPLYPILINLLTKVTGNFIISGILISFFSTFLAMQLLFRLMVIEFGRQKAQKGLLTLLFFPTSFYFLTVYTEGLFFLLAILAFLSIRQKNFILATISVAAASATRITGLGLVFALLTYVYLSGGFNKKNWFVLLAPAGFLAYSFYLFLHTGDPLYFIQAESHFWKGGLVFPGAVLIHSFRQIITSGFILSSFRDLEFFFAIFGIVMLWRVWKNLSIDYTIYVFFALLLPLFSPTIAAIPRYLLTIFPLFMAFSFYKNTYILFFYQFFSLMLLSIYAILFINGYWTS